MAQGFTFNRACKGVTQRGTACQRRVVYANGLCSHHGGDSAAFMKARAKRLAEKAHRRIERLKRKLRRVLCD